MKDKIQRLFAKDPLLYPYCETIERRLSKIEKMRQILTQGEKCLADRALGHEYFGLHFRGKEWVFREWAPNATSVFIIGNMTGWKEDKKFSLHRTGKDGIWEINFPADALSHKDLYRLKIHWPGGSGDRIPAYATRVVQDPETLIFNAQVWNPQAPYKWRYRPLHHLPEISGLLIYEAHVGMAQEEERIGTYREFADKIIPEIVDAGYNAIQLMAIQEHPYYGSFGYQVSNFFAASSRFGTPYDLKELVDTAHCAGLMVIMDLVHSHGVVNEVEGLSRFDGTYYQYFHDGPRGFHKAWNSRCFDYGKYQVLHFLLSNCRFWLDEYRFDGFRFDGVTSMLYLDHGLGKAFTSYDDYFNKNVDEDALVYLALANEVIHSVKPDAITIAEDVSGMPGLALEADSGGIGFNYRFAMGVPDYWIKLIKDTRDEDWHMGRLWFELTNRRNDEKTISYAESHDQALVGDQTIIFRLIGSDMYYFMEVGHENWRVDRGIALHKMIRLITLATAGHGYLNFMGNEFGHPEWIDFPRKGNNWSYKYARRQWSLAKNPSLKYGFLGEFDKDMIKLAKNTGLYKSSHIRLIKEDSWDKILIFSRRGLIFAFNFHPVNSYENYSFEIDMPSEYRMVLDSDSKIYGGHGRLYPFQRHFTLHNEDENSHFLSLYLPSRTAIILKSMPFLHR